LLQFHVSDVDGILRCPIVLTGTVLILLFAVDFEKMNDWSFNFDVEVAGFNELTVL
jgi:hypothetical protein